MRSLRYNLCLQSCRSSRSHQYLQLFFSLVCLRYFCNTTKLQQVSRWRGGLALLQCMEGLH